MSVCYLVIITIKLTLSSKKFEILEIDVELAATPELWRVQLLQPDLSR